MTPEIRSVERESATAIVRRNFSDTVVSSLRTFGRAVGMAQESVAGTVGDLVRREFQWRETL
ncbi:ABC transporter permease, partial [Nocardia puris]|nr:ABC transporter permease [Nocardia puris]MBF6370054.1 ABC transporter permease [Nocardia puris]MBF6463480.1 ABC transporter permease [Nocardia puris]